MTIAFTINGRKMIIEAAPNRRAVDLIREDLRLTGTKEGCNEGECGSCMVLLDSRPVNSCLVLAVEADGHDVTTIEGLGDWWAVHTGAARASGPLPAPTTAPRLHPLQEQFLKLHAVQDPENELEAGVWGIRQPRADPLRSARPARMRRRSRRMRRRESWKAGGA